MEHYDIIIAGAGIAGWSLAYSLSRSPLRGCSILIVDKDEKITNDRTMAYWVQGATPFESIVYRTWDKVRVVHEAGDHSYALSDYRYDVIRGLDFYRYVRACLSDCPNVTFRKGRVRGIEDGEGEAVITVGRERFAGRWVFDGVFRVYSFDPPGCANLHQCFKGWVIETDAPAFDDSAATLFDFRTPQDGELRFFYVLPYSERRALVEFVLMRNIDDEDAVIQHYIEKTLEIDRYQIVEEEAGVSPMTEYAFPRRTGRHVMTIGTKGGMIKPSSGYAFTRILDDSEAIVASLVQNGHPFDIPPLDPAFFRFCDWGMVKLMQYVPTWLARVFVAMFAHNAPDSVFRFLDGDAGPLACARLAGSMVPPLTAHAFAAMRNAPRRRTVVDQV